MRKNLLSDLALEPLKETLDWHLDCDDLDPENLYCWKCMSVAEFNKRTTNRTFCMACGTTICRPRYMLSTVYLKEKKITPKMDLKWWELEFDEDCLKYISDHLESHERTTPEEFENMVWTIGNKFMDDFSATINTPLIAVTKKDKKAIADKQELLDHFDNWIKRRFAERYWDMYHRQAVFELYEMARQICMEMTRKVNNAVHAAIPTITTHILAVTQNFHRLAKEELDTAKWYVEPVMPLVYDLLFLASRNIFRHFASSNLDCRPDSVSCGERYSTIAMESGRVVTIGNQDDLIESFKEEILGNLPSRFRKMFALLRVKKAKKYAAEQKRAAKMIEQVNAAEKEILRAREDQEIAEQKRVQEAEEERVNDEELSYVSRERSQLSNYSGHSSPQPSLHSIRSSRSQRSQKTKQSNQSESDEENGENEENEENRENGRNGENRGNGEGRENGENGENRTIRDNNRNNREYQNENENNQENSPVPAYYNNHNQAVKKRIALEDVTQQSDNVQNHIVFDPMSDSDLRNDEQDEYGNNNENNNDNNNENNEENENGPESPIRYSPVRQSPVRRMTGLGVQKKKSSELALKVMNHQIPPFVEIEADDHHDGKVLSSQPVLHARDVLDDPDDFNYVFEKIVVVYKNGHHAYMQDDPDAILQETEATYTFAKNEWGDEEFMKEHAHNMQENREKHRLETHIKRHADEILLDKNDYNNNNNNNNNNQNEENQENQTNQTNQNNQGDHRDEDSLDEFRSEFDDSLYDASVVTELGGLDVHDGERIMENDAVYVFSGGRTTTKMMKIGSSDQEDVDGTPIKGNHRSFFSNSRPRIRTHDMFGRRYK